MKILFLSHGALDKASFFHAYQWGRSLVRRGHQVTVMGIATSRRLGFRTQQRDGVLIVETPDLFWGRLRTGWDPWDTLNRILHESRSTYDLVHCIDSRPIAILPALFLQRLRGATMILSWLDWWGRGGTIRERSNSILERMFEPVETFFEEGFRTYADGTVVLTSALEGRALGLGVPAERVIRLPHGADVENIHPRNKREARASFGLGQELRIVGYVGQIFRNDADLLLNAFHIMRRQDPGLRLLLIGNCNLVPPQELLDSGQVLRTGWVSYDDLQQYIATCDVMLLPLKDSIANRGRWPSKLGDYLAAGRPVVASSVGDLPALFSHGSIGRLAKDSAEDFAEKVLDLLESRDCDSVSENARRIAETELAWPILAERLDTFYRNIRERRRETGATG